MNSKLILLIGAGVLGYMWWQSQNSLPADAVAVSATPLQAGQTATTQSGSGSQTLTGPGYVYYSPSSKMYYVNSTAPTQAQLTAGAALFNPSATGTATNTGTTGSATSGTTSSEPGGTTATSPAAANQPATYQIPGGGSAATPTTLSGLWAAIQQWAGADTSFTSANGVLSNTPYHWAFYLKLVWPNAPTGVAVWPPDLSQVFPGVDLNQPMDSNTFWGGMGTFLQGKGLSGMYGMGGISTAFAVRGRGGWAA